MPLNNFDYSLSWSDFTQQASRPHGELADAFTEVRFRLSYNYARRANGITVTDAIVNIVMVKQVCWVVAGRATNDLLKHELGHFDITALGVREFYNTLLTITSQSVKELQTKIIAEHTTFQQKIDRTNIRYDSQTNHSQNTQVQQQWNQQVANEKQKPEGSIDNLPQ